MLRPLAILIERLDNPNKRIFYHNTTNSLTIRQIFRKQQCRAAFYSSKEYKSGTPELRNSRMIFLNRQKLFFFFREFLHSRFH